MKIFWENILGKYSEKVLCCRNIYILQKYCVVEIYIYIYIYIEHTQYECVYFFNAACNRRYKATRHTTSLQTTCKSDLTKPVKLVYPHQHLLIHGTGFARQRRRKFIFNRPRCSRHQLAFKVTFIGHK